MKPHFEAELNNRMGLPLNCANGRLSPSIDLNEKLYTDPSTFFECKLLFIVNPKSITTKTKIKENFLKFFFNKKYIIVIIVFDIIYVDIFFFDYINL